jgi:hypothetical protein
LTSVSVAAVSSFAQMSTVGPALLVPAAIDVACSSVGVVA